MATGVLLAPSILADPRVIIGMVTIPTVLVVILLLGTSHDAVKATATSSAQQSQFEDVRVSLGTGN